MNMEATRSGATILREWLDNLEPVLEAEAKLAGLLGHGTMTGNAREFFVSRILRSVLPQTAHVGSGKVIDAAGNYSKQIDIIVYDSRVPFMRTEGGGGLYFVEGVLACVEVKSRLTGKALAESLDNCLSVMNLCPRLTNFEDLNEFANYLKREQGLTEEEAVEMAKGQVTPKTYIFAYTSGLSTPKISEVLGCWYREKGEPVSSCNIHLPRVIVAGKTVAVANDGWMTFTLGEDGERFRRQFGETARPAMGVWRTDHRFGWLALHIAYNVCGRFGIVNRMLHVPNRTFGVEYSISSYNPAALYFEEQKGSKSVMRYVVRTGETNK
jgi:hypothetical protein